MNGNSVYLGHWSMDFVLHDIELFRRCIEIVYFYQYDVLSNIVLELLSVYFL